MVVNTIAKFLAPFAPSRNVPKTYWRAETHWSVTPKNLLILFSGLFLMGLSGSLSVKSNIGNTPWTALAQGLSRQTNTSIGISFFMVSCLVLLIWFPLKVRPGFGTIANMVFFAAALQVGVTLIPSSTDFFLSLIMVLSAIALSGFGTALYISCGLGAGPRDGWMIGFVDRTNLKLWKIRLVIELFALITGFLLGGKVGIGTVLIMLFIGQAIAISLTLLDTFSRWQTRSE